jgi:2-dehydro-3-deoxygluconokinase
MRYAKNYSSRIAGAETNTLIGLSRLGHKTGWISRVGKDEFGASLLAAVRGEGVNTDEVIEDSEAPTGIFFKEMINEKQVRVQYYRSGSAASRLRPGDLNEEYLSSAKYLYITGITPALSETCKDCIFKAIEIARKHRVKIVFDPNVRKKLWSEVEAKKTLLALAAQSDMILAGSGEGEFLFGTSDSSRIAAEFQKLGASIVAVKLGRDGVYYKAGKEEAHIPGVKVDRVVDPVGAGDGFAAGFLSGLLDGLPVRDAAKRGNSVGAMVVTVAGDIEGLPDRGLLEEFENSAEDVSR